MIGRKFGKNDGGWSTRDIRTGFVTGLWKEIRKDWVTLFQNASFTLEDGRRISFWKDN